MADCEAEGSEVSMSARDRLRPPDGEVWIVRWIRADGTQVKHNFYRRRHDAERRADRLRRYGKHVALYRTPTAWIKSTRTEETP